LDYSNLCPAAGAGFCGATCEQITELPIGAIGTRRDGAQPQKRLLRQEWEMVGLGEWE
jgi:hypothetical protein